MQAATIELQKKKLYARQMKSIDRQSWTDIGLYTHQYSMFETLEALTLK